MKLIPLMSFGSIVAGLSTGDHPIDKVIALLDDLKEKAEEQGKEEAVAFTKFQYWCRNSIKKLKQVIQEEKATIDSLESKIESKTEIKEVLEEKIKDLDDQIAKLETDQKNADDTRKKGNALWKEKDKDIELTLEGIADAMKAIEGAKDAQGFLLAQNAVQAVAALLETKTSSPQSQELHEFLQTDPVDVKAKGDSKSHVKKYNFKSGNVLDLLKEMKLMFEDEQTQTLSEETAAQNAHDLETQARDAATDAAKDSRKEKDSVLTDTKKILEEAKSDLKNTEDELDADEATLKTTDTACSEKRTEWEQRSEVRQGELDALDAAKKILAKATGVRTEAPDNPVPLASPVDFFQTAKELSSTDPKMVALNFLRAEASREHSQELERLAQQVKAHLTGPFTEVNDMITKMILRLQAEQKDEDAHKNWCDSELGKTEDTISQKEDKLDDLDKTLKADKAKVQKLSTQIKDAEEMVADITAFIDEATEVRQIGMTENRAAIKDSQDAQTAIAQAIAVLQDFYGRSGEIDRETFDFAQRGVKLPDKPATWDASYTGVSNPKSQPGGIITVLEETSADFAKMEAETKAQEAEDQKTFQEDISSHKLEKSKREKEIDTKSEEKKEYSANIVTMEKMLKTTQAEKDAAEKYDKELQPACVDGDSSYDDRKKARKKEINALMEAVDKLKNAFKKDALIAKTTKTSSFLQMRT